MRIQISEAFWLEHFEDSWYLVDATSGQLRSELYVKDTPGSQEFKLLMCKKLTEAVSEVDALRRKVAHLKRENQALKADNAKKTKVHQAIKTAMMQ